MNQNPDNIGPVAGSDAATPKSGWRGSFHKLGDGIKRGLSKGNTVLNLGNPLDENFRIAVVGASRSGKTVLLTSLIDHLRNHSPDLFPLDSSTLSRKVVTRITRYEELPVEAPLATFAYQSFRKALVVDGQWPRKTRDTYQYKIRLVRDDGVLGLNKTVLLSFLDFPGERIADSPIASNSYEQWSDFALASVPACEGLDQLLTTFHSLAGNPASTAEAVVDSYKTILARRLKAFHTAISPSTFALCPEGSTARKQASEADLVRERFTGLTPDNQFCPLPKQVRDSREELATRFKSAYMDYQKQLIHPLYQQLGKVDRLCLLVNIPEILQSGVEAYNDHVELLRHVLAYCCPKHGRLQELAKRVIYKGSKLIIKEQFQPGHIGKVALVATQADRVWTRDTTKLLRLIQELGENALRGLPQVRIPLKPFTCVAVNSTRPAKTEGRLFGAPMAGPAGTAGGNEMIEFAVSRLPRQWPANWASGDYRFPDVKPCFSQNKNRPPPQVGLDRIFNFLIT